MEFPRASLKELVDPRNRDVVATNTPKLWACYRRSMNRAAYFLSLAKLDEEGKPVTVMEGGKAVVVPMYPRQQQKADALNEAMFQTASMGGAGMLALRDAAIGSKMPAVAVGIQQPTTLDGVPHL